MWGGEERIHILALREQGRDDARIHILALRETRVQGRNKAASASPRRLRRT